MKGTTLTGTWTAKEFGDRLRRRARRAGVQVSPGLISALFAYYELLWRWNQKINLTSLSTPEDAIDRLLVEPLIAARHLVDLPSGAAVLDLGSGGGSPALPLKLALPAIRLWMVESKTRKSAFLREAVRHLALSNVLVETARFEELLTRPELHEAMDVLTVRAVRVAPSTLMTIQAFLKPGARLLWFRAGEVPTKVFDAMPPLAWEASHPLGSGGGQLVILRKQPYPFEPIPKNPRGVTFGRNILE